MHLRDAACLPGTIRVQANMHSGNSIASFLRPSYIVQDGLDEGDTRTLEFLISPLVRRWSVDCYPPCLKFPCPSPRMFLQ